jgi:PAS domain S-box-containing protein
MTKPLEEKLKEYEHLCTSLPDAMLIIGEDGSLLMISKQMEELSGYVKEEWLGKEVFEVPFIRKEDKILLRNNLQRRMADEEIVPYTIEVLSKGGKKMFVEINGRKIKYSGQDAILLVLRDITERKRVENKLQEAYAELERVNKHLVGRELQMAELKKRIQELESGKQNEN